ncbi:hypothetical protein E2562_036967 [Oryza meyeriana var. granulata]|uniref:FAS1 domain-containing protein n=1 Tax=Oryza meyeriana var. granulata TaxID=110450 RepID=A0A6G1CXF7_9ORYZ|nr:hypothetical protein E2562_036967 [Oryza meyeriana var. granulata]
MALARILAASIVFLLQLLLCVSLLCPVGASHNVTAILSANPGFTELTAAKNSANLTPEIDVLAVDNDVMAADPMYKNGCASFTSLVMSDKAAEELYEKSFKGGGLTVFCPPDNAVAEFIPTFRNLTADAKLELLLYHAVATYYSEKALKTINGEVNTLAADGGKGLNLTIRDDDGATVKLSSSSGNEARVNKTIEDMDPHAMYLIDAVLLPRGQFNGSAGTGAPSPTPITSPAPAPATKPSPSPKSQPAPKPAPASAPTPMPDADNQPPKNGASGGMASWSLLSAAAAAALQAIGLVLW